MQNEPYEGMLSEYLKGEMRVVNAHIPVQPKSLAELQKEEYPGVLARDGSVYLIKRRELDFLAVQDLFMTETARLADVVFPAASFAEVDGTFLGPKGEMLQLRSALPRLGRPDWQILAELGRKMGGAGFDFSDSGTVAEELMATGWAEQKIPAGQIDAKPAQSLLLVEGPSIFQFGSNTRTSKVADLGYLTRNLEMEISPQDAKKLGVQPGDPLLADLGERTIRASAKISRRVTEGVLRIPGMESRASEVRVRKDA
jgi:predicted molibdopterin-dependent oxidoreductase YjgC